MIRLLLTEGAIEMFFEKTCKFYDRQTMVRNIVILRSSSAQNVQAVHHRDFGKVTQAKQIISTQTYDKI